MLIIIAAAALLTACVPEETIRTDGTVRAIELNGQIITEEEVGRFVTWRCKDYVHWSGTLVEVGYADVRDFGKAGFILFEGGNAGQPASYQLKGINHRWDWGPSGNDFAFVVKPDGTGLFYDFSTAETVKATDVFECKRY